MIRECDPVFDVRLSQQQLKELYERNPALAKRNQAPVMPIAASSVIPAKHNSASSFAFLQKAERSKYGNIKVQYKGMKFDSKKELRCWQELELRQKAGEIQFLKRQVPFLLVVNGRYIGRFTADFAWQENGETIVADCKSPATRKETAYRLRKKIFEAQFAPLVIREL